MKMQSKSNRTRTENTKRSGIAYALASFSLWGILPIYWKLLQDVQSGEILMHRIVWSFFFAASLLCFQGRWKELWPVFGQPRKLFVVFTAAILVSVNWGIYIWAVNAGHVLDASLGYYINPLFSICLGLLVLRERLNLWQVISLLLAFGGVLVLASQYQGIPWIALSLALTFSLYGLVKKMAGMEAVLALTLETLVLLPLAVGYLGFLELRGQAHFGHSSPLITILLIVAGIVTALPLIWFAQATQRIPLSVVGFVHYLTPTLMLFIGVFLYNEPFTVVHLVGFGLIWGALLIFSLSESKCFTKYRTKNSSMDF